MDYKEVKDSGKREEFNTGSRRDTRAGKGRYDLISPIFLARLAKHLENGAVKYGDKNWEKGQPVSRYFDSAIRHMYKYLEGYRDEDHLSAAGWNIQAMIHTEEMIVRGSLPKELNDMPNYLESKEEPVYCAAEFICPDNKYTCTLSYACDACPYNRDLK